MAEQVECLVIGGGVIGMAVGRQLAMDGLEVLVAEAEASLAMHTSSRNSEVIHAGIYYPTNSLKAKMCVAGKQQLYRYCEDKGVSFRKTGKIIVATDDEQYNKLHGYQRQAEANGVSDLRLLSVAEVAEIEPEVRCAAGLHSPSTGIVDSHEFILALQGDLENAKGNVVLRSRVQRVLPQPDYLLLEIGDSTVDKVRCKYLVNAAGLWAQQVAAIIHGIPASSIPKRHLGKGHYFSYQGKSPFTGLVYPVASGGGLGIHATIDLAGQARFGPEVTWVPEIDYDFDESRKAEFVAAISSYYPALDSDRLVPSYTGIRPKLSGPGEPAADFDIQGPDRHGVPGLVNLFGIDSPGLTAALAIGEYVRDLLLSSR